MYIHMRREGDRETRGEASVGELTLQSKGSVDTEKDTDIRSQRDPR